MIHFEEKSEAMKVITMIRRLLQDIKWAKVIQQFLSVYLT